MRPFAAILIVGVLASGGTAHASSFVSLTPMNAPRGPSMIALDNADDRPASSPEAEASTGFVAISPSIIASANALPIGTERTTANGDKTTAPRRHPALGPMVIRGGIVGNAFARSAPEPEPEDTGEEPLWTPQDNSLPDSPPARRQVPL